jgi:RNA polymerase sigma factor (sigma-70 family)
MTDTDGPIRPEALLAHAGWLQGLTRALVVDPHDADDLTQETWLAAIEHPPRSGGSPRGWLYRVARNAAHAMRLRSVRRSRRERIASRPEGIPDPARVVERVELAQRLARMIQSLDEPYRTTIVLRFLEGWTTAEIGARSGRPASTVRSHVERGLARLRRMLDDEHDGRRGVWTAALIPFLGLDAVTRSPASGAAGTVLGGALVGKKLAVGLGLLLILVAGVVVSRVWPPSAEAPPPMPEKRVAALEEAREPEVAESSPVPTEVPEEPAEAPGLPEAPIAEPAPPPPIAEPIRLRVKNLTTGEAVTGLEVRSGDRSLTTDSEGIILVPPREVRSLAPVPGEAWRLARAVRQPRESEEHVLWAYRTMKVRGRVTSVSGITGPDVDRVELVAQTDRPRRAGAGSMYALLRRNRLHRIDLSDALTPDGGFLVEVPRVAGYRLIASVPGWQPASAVLTTAESQFVFLRLTGRKFAVRGTLRDQAGDPISDATIMTYVIIVMPLTELDRAAIGSLGQGYTLGTNKGKNRAVLKYENRARTGPDGRFEVLVPAKGRLVVVARPKGDFHPTLLKRSSFEDDVDGLEITAVTGDGRKARVERSGVPFHGSMSLVDVTETAQCMVGLNLSKSNEFYMARLITGHQYSIHIRGEEFTYHGFLTWDERGVIELSTLSKEADLSKVSPECR